MYILNILSLSASVLLSLVARLTQLLAHPFARSTHAETHAKATIAAEREAAHTARVAELRALADRFEEDEWMY